MPKCPHFGCEKTAIFRRNLRCGNCDSSRHAPRASATFANNSSQTTSQAQHDTINNLAYLNLLQQDSSEVHTSSPPTQPINSCNSTEQSSTGYSSGGYSSGCSSDGYGGGGGDFGGGGSGSDY